MFHLEYGVAHTTTTGGGNTALFQHAAQLATGQDWLAAHYAGRI